MIKYSLSGSWQMKNVKDSNWLKVNVPGSVLSALISNNKIEDPYYGENEYIVRELFREDYEFIRSFEVKQELLEQTYIDLVCYGLDTLAEIYINGHKVAYTDNMHRTWRIACKEYLILGTNEIRIVFKAPITYIENYEAQEGKKIDFITCGAMKNNQYIRKAHSMFGWDWGPQLPDAGIWRDIELVGYSEVRIEDVIIDQEHFENHVKLHITTKLDIFKQGHYELKYRLHKPNGQQEEIKSMIVSEEENSVIDISNPELWWPNGYGKQPLYYLEVELYSEGCLVQQKRYTLGLRTLTISQEKDQWGKEFTFEINGIKIFTRGANYIPEDCIYSWITTERMEYLIQSSVKANFNCLRIWGGGYYPSDEFYELCNRYGIIVWQDLMYACNIYEVNDDFADNIVEETKDNVRRLRHHPCLGLWCGNNEIESAWENWGGFKDHSKQLKADYIKQFEYLLPKTVEEHDKKTFYWPSSPSSGGCFEEPDSEDVGDAHYWDVWHGQKPFSDYQKYFFRFCSEFGFQSFPSIKTIETFAASEDLNIFSRVMESHQKNPAANGKILYYLSETFRYPKDFDSLIYTSQLLQGMAIKSGVEHWRRNRGRCMGTLYWQLNDNWPVASWSSIDYYGRWKALHYMAKDFYAPLAGSIFRENSTNRVLVHLQNETLEEHTYKVSMTLKTTDLQELHKVEYTGAVMSLSVVKVGELDYTKLIKNQQEKVFLEVLFEDDRGRRKIEVETFVPYKHMELPKSDLKYQVKETENTYEISIETQYFAPFVELDLKDADAVWEENYFHMTDKKEKVIILKKEGIIKGEICNTNNLLEQLTVRSLRDTY